MNPFQSDLHAVIARLASRAAGFFFPRIIFKMPPGITPDNSAMGGLFGLINNLNEYAQIPTTVATASSVSNTITGAQIASGIILRTGSPGGAVADTTDTAANIVAAFSSTIILDGTYQMPLRYINSGMGQTITLGGGSGVTITGTATIANNAWRDFAVILNSPTAVTFQNIGGGTL